MNTMLYTEPQIINSLSYFYYFNNLISYYFFRLLIFRVKAISQILFWNHYVRWFQKPHHCQILLHYFICFVIELLSVKKIGYLILGQPNSILIQVYINIYSFIRSLINNYIPFFDALFHVIYISTKQKLELQTRVW